MLIKYLVSWQAPVRLKGEANYNILSSNKTFDSIEDAWNFIEKNKEGWKSWSWFWYEDNGYIQNMHILSKD